MEPKKRNVMDYFILVIGMIFVLYMATYCAISYDSVKDSPIDNSYYDFDGNFIEKKDFDYGLFFTDLMERMENQEKIKWSESIPKFWIWGVGIYGFFIAYYELTKKNLITNKEYGTARWATREDIKHLFAENIKKERLKDLKEEKLSLEEERKKKTEIEEKYKEHSEIILTKTEKICRYNYELNDNMLIFGGSGALKTTGYVLPNLLQCDDSPYNPSYIITDPKGEILMRVGKYLDKICHYDIKVLNLKEQNRSFCFNPLLYIEEEKFEEQIAVLADQIMNSKVDTKTSVGNDPFWPEMATVVWKSLLYAVYEGFDVKDRTIPQAIKLFRWFEVSDHDDRYRNPTKLDKFFEVFGDVNGTLPLREKIVNFYNAYCTKEILEVTEVLPSLLLPKHKLDEKIAIPIGEEKSRGLEAYQKEFELLLNTAREMDVSTEQLESAAYCLFEEIENYKKCRKNNYKDVKKPIGVILYEKYGGVDENPALRCWEDFRTKCKGKTAQSVTATLLSKIAPFDEKEIRRIFSKDEMEIDLIGERKTAVFVVLPPTLKTYNFIFNMFQSTVFNRLEYCATVKHDQRLPVDVHYILDEAYNTGRFPQFENVLSYGRGLGIGVTVIFQAFDQMKEIYEKSWGTILDNCDVFLYLGKIRQLDTLQYISSLIGKGTYDKQTYSRTKSYHNPSTGHNDDRLGRDLQDTAEVQKLKRKNCYLFINGYNAFFSEKYNYRKHPNYKYTADANKKNKYYYQTPDEKAAMKDKFIQVEYEKIEPIAMNTNSEEVVSYFKNNILRMGIDSGEEVAMARKELAELELIEQIMEEEEKENSKIAEMIDDYANISLIEMQTSSKEINQIAEELKIEQKDVGFIDVDAINEEFPHGDEIEQAVEIMGEVEKWEEDSIENLQKELELLEQSIQGEDFWEQLNSVDLNDFEKGIVNEAI